MPSTEADLLRTAPSTRAVGPALFALVVVAVLQGGVGIAVTMVEVPTATLACGRCLLACLILALTARLLRRPLWRVPDRGALAVCGVLLGLHWLVLFEAFRVSTVAVATVSVFTFPLMTSLAEPWFFGGRPGLRQVACALGGLAGVVVLLSDDLAHPGTAAGVGWGLLGAALFAVRMIISRRLMGRSDGITLMVWQSGIAGLALLPLALWAGIGQPGWGDLLGLVLIALVFTAVPHTLAVAVLDRLSAASVGIITSLQVPAAICYAWWLLDQRADGSVALGAGLVVGAAVVESLAQVRRRRSPAPEPALAPVT